MGCAPGFLVGAPDDRHAPAGSQLPVLRRQSKIGFMPFHPVLLIMAEVADARVKTAAGARAVVAIWQEWFCPDGAEKHADELSGTAEIGKMRRTKPISLTP